MARGVNKVILVQLYRSGMSIPQVADSVGLSRSTVRYHLRSAGVLRSRTEGVLLAASDGRLGSGLRGKKRVFSKSWCRAISAAKLAHGEANAKGVSLKPNGYLEYTRGENKGRAVHRVLAEKMLGRELLSCEHVHHIDEDKQNNNEDNLVVLTISEHMKIHAKENHFNRERDSLGRFA